MQDDNTSLHYVMGHLASELANFDDLADPGFKKAVANGMAALQAILDDCGAGGIVVYENEVRTTTARIGSAAALFHGCFYGLLNS